MMLLRETPSGSSAPIFLYPSSSARASRSLDDNSEAAGIVMAPAVTSDGWCFICKLIRRHVNMMCHVEGAEHCLTVQQQLYWDCHSLSDLTFMIYMVIGCQL